MTGEVERLRNRIVWKLAQCDDSETRPRDLVDALLAAVRADERERRDQEWIDGISVVIIDRASPKAWRILAASMRYEEKRDGAWRKIEPVESFISEGMWNTIGRVGDATF